MTTSRVMLTSASHPTALSAESADADSLPKMDNGGGGGGHGGTSSDQDRQLTKIPKNAVKRMHLPERLEQLGIIPSSSSKSPSPRSPKVSPKLTKSFSLKGVHKFIQHTKTNVNEWKRNKLQASTHNPPTDRLSHHKSAELLVDSGELTPSSRNKSNSFDNILSTTNKYFTLGRRHSTKTVDINDELVQKLVSETQKTREEAEMLVELQRLESVNSGVVYSYGVFRASSMLRHRDNKRKLLQIDLRSDSLVLIGRGCVEVELPLGDIVCVEPVGDRGICISTCDESLELAAESCSVRHELLLRLHTCVLHLLQSESCRGILEKRSKSIASHWSKKEVLIKNGKLYYRSFPSKRNSKMISIDIRGSCSSVKQSGRCQFHISTPSKLHVFRDPSGNAANAAKWISLLNEAQNHVTSSSTSSECLFDLIFGEVDELRRSCGTGRGGAEVAAGLDRVEEYVRRLQMRERRASDVSSRSGSVVLNGGRLSHSCSSVASTGSSSPQESPAAAASCNLSNGNISDTSSAAAADEGGSVGPLESHPSPSIHEMMMMPSDHIACGGGGCPPAYARMSTFGKVQPSSSGAPVLSPVQEVERPPILECAHFVHKCPGSSSMEHDDSCTPFSSQPSHSGSIPEHTSAQNRTVGQCVNSGPRRLSSNVQEGDKKGPSYTPPEVLDAASEEPITICLESDQAREGHTELEAKPLKPVDQKHYGEIITEKEGNELPSFDQSSEVISKGTATPHSAAEATEVTSGAQAHATAALSAQNNSVVAPTSVPPPPPPPPLHRGVEPATSPISSPSSPVIRRISRDDPDKIELPPPPLPSADAPVPPPPPGIMPPPPPVVSGKKGGTKTKAPALKPIHWKPIRANDIPCGSMWHNHQPRITAEQKERLANLFKIDSSTKKKRSTSKKPAHTLYSIDQNRARNLELFLKRGERNIGNDLLNRFFLLKDLEQQMHFLQQVRDFQPSEADIKHFSCIASDQVSVLPPLHQHMFAICSIPHFSAKLEVLQLICEIREQSQMVESNIEAAMAACEAVAANRKLHSLLAFCLTVGNTVNEGARRNWTEAAAAAAAAAFSVVNSLHKFAELKSAADGSPDYSLLHFIVEVVASENPDILSVTDELHLQHIDFISGESGGGGGGGGAKSGGRCGKKDGFYMLRTPVEYLTRSAARAQQSLALIKGSLGEAPAAAAAAAATVSDHHFVEEAHNLLQLDCIYKIIRTRDKLDRLDKTYQSVLLQFAEDKSTDPAQFFGAIIQFLSHIESIRGSLKTNDCSTRETETKSAVIAELTRVTKQINQISTMN